ncbi:tetratricopeptide repeat protein [Actinoplanes regularis]|uniref:Tetratricopeptide repeat-containing protein n=1 Tax=Actinoplanes regularis TaxID=52697 RepID=A0A239EYY2_9ACTN|nr:tetratricopeptide repeat protein [Actinoplanes regularis]GIE89749.1 hypothetical protein Are01nite_62290 [Actinoplanes regularis]SNS49044.1 Tetratricopeptide repeat-containing protein [Actinoplanes regularis]
MSHPSPLTPALERAHSLVAAGDLAGAAELLERAIEIGRATLSHDDPDVLATQRELASLRHQAGDPAAARRALETAYEAGRFSLGDDDPLMLQISYDLGVVAEELGNRQEARQAFSRVADFGPMMLGPGHWAVTRAQAYLGQDSTAPARVEAAQEWPADNHPTVLWPVLPQQGDQPGPVPRQGGAQQPDQLPQRDVEPAPSRPAERDVGLAPSRMAERDVEPTAPIQPRTQQAIPEQRQPEEQSQPPAAPPSPFGLLPPPNASILPPTSRETVVDALTFPHVPRETVADASTFARTPWETVGDVSTSPPTPRDIVTDASTSPPTARETATDPLTFTPTPWKTATDLPPPPPGPYRPPASPGTEPAQRGPETSPAKEDPPGTGKQAAFRPESPWGPAPRTTKEPAEAPFQEVKPGVFGTPGTEAAPALFHRGSNDAVVVQRPDPVIMPLRDEPSTTVFPAAEQDPPRPESITAGEQAPAQTIFPVRPDPAPVTRSESVAPGVSTPVQPSRVAKGSPWSQDQIPGGFTTAPATPTRDAVNEATTAFPPVKASPAFLQVESTAFSQVETAALPQVESVEPTVFPPLEASPAFPHVESAFPQVESAFPQVETTVFPQVESVETTVFPPLKAGPAFPQVESAFPQTEATPLFPPVQSGPVPAPKTATTPPTTEPDLGTWPEPAPKHPDPPFHHPPTSPAPPYHQPIDQPGVYQRGPVPEQGGYQQAGHAGVYHQDGSTHHTGVYRQAESGVWQSGSDTPHATPPTYEKGSNRKRGMALFAVIAATLAAVVAVAAMVFTLAQGTRKGDKDNNPPGSPTLAGSPPGAVKLADLGTKIDVTWTDPSDSTVSFMVTMAHPGEQLKPVSAVGPGQTSRRIEGLSSTLDYCFAVVAVYGTNKFATSAQVCTDRGKN